jgi:ubiquinone/menaquinone biosynthesis C-methylase UbiE
MEDRRLNDDEIARARSYDDVADTYEHLNAPIFFDAPGRALAEFAGIIPEQKVLDAGAGTGAVTRAAAAAGARVVAFDISVNMLLAARRSGASHAVNGALPELPFLDAVFDRVCCAFVLTHVDDPDAAIDDMRRVLKPGGRIALSSWSPWEDVYSAACAEIMGEFVNPARIAETSQRVLPSEARFSAPAGVLSLLESHGLRDVRGETRSFEFSCSVEALVASREVCASGRALRTLLDDAQWKAYRERSLQVLGNKFPGGIHYLRDVHFAAGSI